MAIAFLRKAVGLAGGRIKRRPVTVDGIWFASTHEARRWGELRMLQRAGHLTGLTRQVAFGLHTIGAGGQVETIGNIVIDFVYWTARNHVTGEAPRRVHEDAKGHPTELWLWKRKHFELEYGAKIEVV